MRRILFALVLLAGAGCGGCSEDQKPTLALDFQPNAVHAGIYAAPSDELEIRVPAASTDSLKLLAAGRADVAVVDIHDLGLARERGSDLVGIGALVQRPLAAVIAGEAITRPRELEGRRVGVTGLPSDDAVLRAVVERDGGDPDRVRRVTIGFSAVPSLIAGRADAVVSFWNAEGVTPRYPELVLVTERATLRERPELVDGLLAALREGTRTALADRDAAVADIVKASGADEPLVRAQLTAVAPALRPPLRLDRRALEGWARFDERFGILAEAPDVSAAFPRR